MKYSLKPVAEQIIVITGASSGIGLATARRAAREGARLVLTSRNEKVLAELVDEIAAAGGRSVYVVADVGERADVQRIADAAITHFGGFDTWVNDAGLSIYGRLEDVSDADHHRLFQTNFWGVVYGSIIAVKHLKVRGGALINLGSVVSDQAVPIQGMYSASKHAIKGFTDALRMELAAAGDPVAVTLIKPASINTPFPQHARNYMNVEPKLPAPVYAPEAVAHAILHAAAHAKREIDVGGAVPLSRLGGRLSPRLLDRLGTRIISAQRREEELPRDPQGTLYEAGVDGRVEGDQPGYVLRTSAYTRATLHPVMTGVALAAVGLTALAWLRRDRNGGTE